MTSKVCAHILVTSQGVCMCTYYIDDTFLVLILLTNILKLTRTTETSVKANLTHWESLKKICGTDLWNRVKKNI